MRLGQTGVCRCCPKLRTGTTTGHDADDRYEAPLTYGQTRIGCVGLGDGPWERWTTCDSGHPHFETGDEEIR